MEVQQTTNYDLFQDLLGNRGIDPVHVEKLIESLKTKNLLATFPVIVNEKMEVIDGQHRIAAAKTLKIPVNYTVVRGLTFDDAMLVNIPTKSWTMQDFLHSHIDMGNKEYQIIADFTKTYEVPISTALVLLAQDRFKKGHKFAFGIRKEFKKGLYHVTTLKEADETMRTLKTFLPYIEHSLIRDLRFLSALNSVVHHLAYDPERMIKKLAMLPYKLQHRTSKHDYLRDLEDVYNYHAMESGMVRFYV